MMPMLQKVKAGGMAIGDENGIIRIIAVMETTSEETCKQVEAMINGGMAMLEMKKPKTTPRALHARALDQARGKDDLDRNEIILRGPHGPP